MINCSVCDLPVSPGELYYRAEIDAESRTDMDAKGRDGIVVDVDPLPDGGGVLRICQACARTFPDQSDWMGAIG